MTVTAYSPSEYSGDGSTVEFNIGFDFQNKSQLEVILRVTATGVETAQVETTHYDVLGIDVVLGIPGTDIEFLTAPPTGTEVHIRRVTAQTQALSLSNAVSTPMESFETEYDKITQIIQEVDARLSRAPLLAKTTPTASVTLEEPAALEYLRWNSGGTGLESTEVLEGVPADLTGVSDGDMLQYDSAEDQFIPVDPSSLGIPIGSLSPVAINTPAAGQVLIFDGSDWINGYAVKVTGTRGAASAIVAGTGVAFTGVYPKNIWFVAGSGGAVNVTANPQVAVGSYVGQELRVFGTHDTNTVTLEHGTGLSLLGDMVLGDGESIDLMWDGTNWAEIGRST